ncbi:UDP-glucose/GDP-mannose dehydrogenase family protein [uncultured Selenomonas sp.]|uniref:UDP-glucose dehydrogenase family protein n=1 Tax=uncultured Selenomonas sp. TaxID=159275 RepID=UPI0025F531FD|nr:UDP-glucose/GDP-mannose dehydrogenase family protein [uncultured Selenomonas sp.]
MKIAMVGTGYVGLVTGTCFSEMGNDVICVDVDAKKIAKLESGVLPIYEPGLVDLVQANMERGSLRFTTEIREALETSELVFIAVGTPMGEDGSADLQYVLGVAHEIGSLMEHPLIVVDKSTVPVGTADRVRATIQEELDQRGSNLTFDVVSNPEFLKEGTACDDFLKPDRVVVGADCAESMQVMQELYRPFILSDDAFIAMDIKSAELTKYAANAMLATKISFINEISNICERVGADVNKVRKGIGSDRRIGYKFIYPGCGYGGSCFPKDVQALIRTSRAFGYDAQILTAVEDVNARQKMVLARKVVRRFGEDLTGRCFAVWGLAFKPGTDDMRQSTAITVIGELTRRGAKVQAYDPKAEREAQECYLKGNDNVIYCKSKYDALDGADAMLLITEWKEFRSPDFLEMGKRMRSKVIIDGRNQYTAAAMQRYGFEYEQIGVKLE